MLSQKVHVRLAFEDRSGQFLDGERDPENLEAMPEENWKNLYPKRIR